MAKRSISSTEVQYIKIGCDQMVRGDGRGHDDYRALTIENDVFPHVNSSARVKTLHGAEVICSISVDIDSPERNREDEGSITFHTDISPSCAYGMDDKEISNYSSDLSEKLQSAYYACPYFPWKSLCILPGKFSWHIKVDFIILQLDGPALDVCSIAAYVAFQKLRIPEFELTIGRNELSEVLQDFEVISDISKSKFYDFSAIPIIVTISKITNKSFIVDPTVIEQHCAGSIVSFAIDKSGDSCAVSIIKHGPISFQDFSIMVEKAVLTVKTIYVQIDRFINSTSFLTEDEALFADLAPSRNGLMV
mmetsp:Transcript_8844/g.9612  ORF Transcript_8844/g.9612 Transcript_8844/m.9612 type:complete len:306 (-) Transcript_8844:38-955(-)